MSIWGRVRVMQMISLHLSIFSPGPCSGDPVYEEAYYDRGVTWIAMGRTKEAQQDLTEALRLNGSKRESIVRQMQGRPTWDLYGQAWDAAAEKQRAWLGALERQALATLN